MKKRGQTYYRFTFYVGMVNGKRKYIKRANFKTKKEARAAFMLLQETLDKPNSDILLSDLTAKWLLAYEKDVADSTYIKTKRNLDRHILPVIGDRKIGDITPLELQSHVTIWADKLKYGRKLLGLVRNIFRYAIRFGYLDNSPAESLSAPKIKRTINTKKNFWNKNELQTFLKLVDKTGNIQKIALFRVLAFTGIRIGELQALEWEDFYDTTLNINKAVSRGHAGLEISTTKTVSSERLISLDAKTVAILNQLKNNSQNQNWFLKTARTGYYHQHSLENG